MCSASIHETGNSLAYEEGKIKPQPNSYKEVVTENVVNEIYHLSTGWGCCECQIRNGNYPSWKGYWDSRNNILQKLGNSHILTRTGQMAETLNNKDSELYVKSMNSGAELLVLKCPLLASDFGKLLTCLVKWGLKWPTSYKNSNNALLYTTVPGSYNKHSTSTNHSSHLICLIK